MQGPDGREIILERLSWYGHVRELGSAKWRKQKQSGRNGLHRSHNHVSESTGAVFWIRGYLRGVAAFLVCIPDSGAYAFVYLCMPIPLNVYFLYIFTRTYLCSYFF